MTRTNQIMKLAILVQLLLIAACKSTISDPRVHAEERNGQEPLELVPNIGDLFVEEVEVSADNSFILTRSQAPVAQIWDFTIGTLRRNLPARHMALCGEDPQVVTSIARRGVDRITFWDPWSGAALRTLDAPSVKSLAVSDDCSLLAAGGGDGVLRIWSEDQKKPRELRGKGSGRVTYVAISKSASRVAAVLHGGPVRMWDWPSGNLLHTFEPGGYISGFVISPDHAFLAAIGRDRTVKIWDLESGDLRRLEGFDGEILDAAISPNSRHLVTAASDGTVRAWNAETGEQVTLVEEAGRRMGSLAFHPSGSHVLAVPTPGMNAYYLDLETGETRHTLESPNAFLSGAVSRDGRILVLAGIGIEIWDTTTGTRRRRKGAGLGRRANIAFTPEGRYLISADDSGTRLWDLSGEQPPTKVDGSHFQIGAAGERLVVGHNCCQGGVRLWDPETRRLIRELAHEEPVETLAIARDAPLLATGGEKGLLRLWDARTGEPRWSRPGPDSPVKQLTITPDGKIVVSRHQNGGIRVWDTESGEMLRSMMREPTEPILAMLVDPDSRIFFTGGPRDGIVNVWPEDRDQPGMGPIRNEPILTPDGRYLVAQDGRVCNGKFTISLWDRKKSKLRLALEGWGESVDQLAADPRGRLLASATDHEVTIWSLTSARALHTFRHDTPVLDLAFDPDSALLAAADQSGGIRLWDVESGTEVIRLYRLYKDAWAVATPDGRWDSSPNAIQSGLNPWRGRLRERTPSERNGFTPGLLAEILGSRGTLRRSATSE